MASVDVKKKVGRIYLSKGTGDSVATEGRPIEGNVS